MIHTTLHNLLRNNSPWGSTSYVKYFQQILQCPECKTGVWSLLNTSFRWATGLGSGIMNYCFPDLDFGESLLKYFSHCKHKKLTICHPDQSSNIKIHTERHTYLAKLQKCFWRRPNPGKVLFQKRSGFLARIFTCLSQKLHSFVLCEAVHIAVIKIALLVVLLVFNCRKSYLKSLCFISFILYMLWWIHYVKKSRFKLEKISMESRTKVCADAAV